MREKAEMLSNDFMWFFSDGCLSILRFMGFIFTRDVLIYFITTSTWEGGVVRRVIRGSSRWLWYGCLGFQNVSATSTLTVIRIVS